MRTQLRAVALACGVLWGLGTAGALVAAEPPLEDFPVGGALSKHVQQMRARAAYWIAAIRDAKTDANVLYARDRLVKDCKDMEAKEAGYAFAEQVAAEANWPLLRKALEKDPLRTAKEVNLAAALSQMPQVSIQPALDAMVTYPGNPAVRYFGWKGYRAARTRLFGQGTQATEKTLSAVEKAAKTETSPPALEQILRMLEIEAVKPSSVSPDIWDSIRKRLWAALAANWKAWCQQVLAGDEEMADAARHAAAAVRSHASWVGELKPMMRKEVLQMLVDLSFCAGQAFVQARTGGKSGDRWATLLLHCEASLNAVAGTNKKFIENALRDPGCNANPVWVIFHIDPKTRENWGALAWAEFLKDQGVVAPKFEAAAPSTAPTSGPTTGRSAPPAPAPK